MNDAKTSPNLTPPNGTVVASRRSALIVAAAATTALPAWLLAQSTAAGAEQRRNTGMQSMQQGEVNELVHGGGVLVVAQWEARAAEAEKVADILQRFLPRAQAEPGVKLFLIARNKANPAQFMFYELFADQAAFAAHQASEHFKTLIAGEALPLLAKRERSEYALL
jgi:quinol monooxygenase YgiN